MIYNITPKELIVLQEKEPKLKLIDLRTKPETEEGMIPGAVWMDMSSREFMNDISALPKDEAYCLYCASGGRSSMAAQFMEMQGFSRVYDLIGGMLSWEDRRP